jgi:hypothetical protein
VLALSAVSILNEFRRRISTLRSASPGDITGRLIAILDWLEHEPSTHAVLGRLRRAIDAKRIFAGLDKRAKRPAAHTPEEIAFVGLTLIENCRRKGSDFLTLCISVGIHPPIST